MRKQQSSEDWNVDLPPLPIKKRQTTTNVYHEKIQETVHELPTLQVIERIVPEETVVQVNRNISVPRTEVLEREIQIPKPVREEIIVPVPEIRYVDKVETTEVVTEKEKLVERPIVILQERIIPIPRRVVHERIVEIPPEEYMKIVPTFAVENNYRTERSRPMAFPELSPDADADPIKQRHEPVAVELPFTHYKAKPVERIVDRVIPIPVELEVVQNFNCPRLVPLYREVPIPIPVTRTIEKPIPLDAVFNQHLLEFYMKNHMESSGAKRRTGAQSAKKMNAQELNAVGATNSTGDVKFSARFDSYDLDQEDQMNRSFGSGQFMDFYGKSAIDIEKYADQLDS